MTRFELEKLLEYSPLQLDSSPNRIMLEIAYQLSLLHSELSNTRVDIRGLDDTLGNFQGSLVAWRDGVYPDVDFSH